MYIDSKVEMEADGDVTDGKPLPQRIGGDIKEGIILTGSMVGWMILPSGLKSWTQRLSRKSPPN